MEKGEASKEPRAEQKPSLEILVWLANAEEGQLDLFKSRYLAARTSVELSRCCVADVTSMGWLVVGRREGREGKGPNARPFSFHPAGGTFRLVLPCTLVS
ncbi:hypothetical protein JMJ77_0014525 [Colletotrichum scovillei]|uniref:Uncharacterized protein n=1 Tax=Colletotrichum scovillei TaxID=1209932 RepID=A0A9P7R593_9PEZI|nr:hypothetical protein JMJ77_0014525 [Colletotrichum scovillei]KAG7066059.1 hypothetical protein JMJ78_0012797 [Colletotrichum scovillei]KAG7068661.1 hypothetical protein JMJ76_0008342 [Colletotrichum scovillei]